MKMSSNIIGALLMTAVGTGAFVMMAKRPLPASGNNALNFGIPVNVTTTATTTDSTANTTQTDTTNNQGQAPEETAKEATHPSDDKRETADTNTVETTEAKTPESESTPTATESNDVTDTPATDTATGNTPTTMTEQVENTPESHSSTTQQNSQTEEKQNTNVETTSKTSKEPETTSQEHQKEASQATTTASPEATSTTHKEKSAPATLPTVPPQQNAAPASTVPAQPPVTDRTTPANTATSQEDYRQKMIKALQQQLKALQDNPNMPIVAPNINNQPATPGNATPQANPQLEIPAGTTQPPRSLQTPRTINIPMGTTSAPNN